MGEILVTGTRGKLGWELCRVLGSRAIGLGRDALDITREDDVQRVLHRFCPQAVVNCAAYTGVDAAEDDQAACWAVNATAVEILARACNTIGSSFVHVSSDYVFGANNDRVAPYAETDATAPVNFYGQAKAAGEAGARKARRHLIVRTSGLYSHAPGACDFVRAVQRLATNWTPSRMVYDHYCTPTRAADVAQAIVNLIDRSETGTYHVTNGGLTTWYEFACEICRLSGVGVPFEPVTREQYGAAAQRPRYSILSTEKYRRLGGPELPTWQAALAAHLDCPRFPC